MVDWWWSLAESTRWCVVEAMFLVMIVGAIVFGIFAPDVEQAWRRFRERHSGKR